MAQYLTMDSTTAAKLRGAKAGRNALDPQRLSDGRYALAAAVLSIEWDAATAAMLKACPIEDIADRQFSTVAAAAAKP